MMLIKWALILCILLCSSVTDIRKREFPNIYQILLLLVYPIGFQIENLLGILLAIPFLTAALKTENMGGGDAKAVCLLGGLIGFHPMLLTLIAGCTGFIICGKYREMRKGGEHISLPFLPFLTAGYLIILILEVWAF